MANFSAKMLILAAVLTACLAGCPKSLPPVAAFTASPLFGQAALPVHFTDMSLSGTADIVEWHWDFGDGGASADRNPDHTYTSPGVYTVSLEVITGDGSSTVVANDYVTVTANDVPMWNAAALQAVAAAKWMPPQAARGLAMMHGAMYDAVNTVDRKGAPFHVNTVMQAGTLKEAALAKAAHRVLTWLFPAQTAAFDAQLDASLAPIPDGDGKTHGIALGLRIADAILQWRSNDNSQMMMMDPFLGGTNPGEWRPTPPDNLPGMFEHWQHVTPFALAAGNQFRPGPPPALDSAAYAAAFNETKTVGAKTGATRTMDQSMMATFWVGMPGTVGEAGRMNQAAQQALAAQPHTLYDTARLFALVNVALADAAIAGIDCKYAYVFWRPITAIREAANDGNDETGADAGWEPYIGTPAHPEYISTHSTLTKAASTVLASFFGADAADITLPSFMDPAMTRHYASFSQIAEEAGLSRIYGGIHFRFSYEAGSQMGQQIGEHVWNNSMALN